MFTNNIYTFGPRSYLLITLIFSGRIVAANRAAAAPYLHTGRHSPTRPTLFAKRDALAKLMGAVEHTRLSMPLVGLREVVCMLARPGFAG